MSEEYKNLTQRIESVAAWFVGTKKRQVGCFAGLCAVMLPVADALMGDPIENSLKAYRQHTEDSGYVLSGNYNQKVGASPEEFGVIMGLTVPGILQPEGSTLSVLVTETDKVKSVKECSEIIKDSAKLYGVADGSCTPVGGNVTYYFSCKTDPILDFDLRESEGALSDDDEVECETSQAENPLSVLI